MTDDQKMEFDPVSFELLWNDLSEDRKARLIEETRNLDPRVAVLPALAGISSFHFSVRNSARKTLEAIQFRIKELVSAPFGSRLYHEGMKAAESVSARLYSLFSPEMNLNDLSFFFKTLLKFDERGACFAFKALERGHVSEALMEKIALSVSEPERLWFVQVYTRMTPALRLRFGPSFRRILLSVKSREHVVEFYARLFDRQRDADPFFRNINPHLRNPDLIIENELNSMSPEIVIKGLKALAMIQGQIAPDILINILESQKVKKLRLAVCEIVENSTMGTYCSVFDSLFSLLGRCEPEEGFHVFRAMVVTGARPLYLLLETINHDFPDLVPRIREELSELSKISFFFIQDIALNREKYRGRNFEINLACILGMMKKRPERVVRILKKYDNHPDDRIRINVIQFIENAGQILAKEKQDMETGFDSVIKTIKKQCSKSGGGLKKLFQSPVSKKIQMLGSKPEHPVDFQAKPVRNADFSNMNFTGPAAFFNNCVINNCNFQAAGLSNTYFKAALFYNVDMQDANFDHANFDHAVFINVNAQRAVFSNCSFQKIRMFNCNFNHADLSHASFTCSEISRCSFNGTQLCYCSFAYANISGVSFTGSKVGMTDFSGIKARFCRFPARGPENFGYENIDYNFRKFQIRFDDMPEIDKTIAEDINLLIFSEFIHYGENKFLKQNRLSLLTAFDIFKQAQADLFLIIPFLIHENFDFPGLGTVHGQTPRGIHGYVPDRETLSAVRRYVDRNEPVARPCTSCAVDGLFTIGSIGSIAQTRESDIDYWVCINEKYFSAQELKLLRDKLAMLETMAAGRFGTKVTFFIVDIAKARENDFGESSIESSGSAQTRLLKEEFYRTMIHIAGKIPLWAVLPTSISLHYYNFILEKVTDAPGLARYIDLGDIHAISTSEYFGASIWQMVKWLKSPFKSVIKMALLEKYIREYGKTALLCNKYKDEWMNSGLNLKLARNDSYYILLDNLIEFFGSVQDRHSINLLLTCFFLKLGISDDSQIDNTVFGLRKILLEKCMEKWGWSKADVFKIGSFRTWQYSRIAKLSHAIEKYMIKKYNIVNKAYNGISHGHSQISREDRIVLERKVFIEFSRQKDKVEKILLVSRSDRHFQGLHLRYLKKVKGAGTWQLFNHNTKGGIHSEENLVRARTIEEIGAWLINNSLYNENTIINLVPNPTYVTFDDIRKLFRAMHEFFTPVLNNPAGFDALLVKPVMTCLFISINFYAPKQQRKVSEYTAVYLNSWGEMFCKSKYFGRKFLSVEETKKNVMATTGIKKMPLNTVFYFSKGVAR